MAIETDPEGVEPRELLGAVDFRAARVLEVGSGDGRLSFRYAHASRFIVGIDPKPDEVLSARKSCPSDLRHRLTFVRGSATSLPFRGEAFDIVLLASAL